ncbi:MAG TPA: alpha/beta hydrolase domain-containing protein [Candidatus Limnocylindria bacterium]|nr:alpha/beta hydrolase domain-containing protein [Candidatus Limnocylindria bacterium]
MHATRTIYFAALAVALLAGPRPAAAAAATPTVEGPITGNGAPLLVGSTLFPLADIGYEQEEFFIGGTATAYASAAPLTADGRWTVTPAETAPYKTRILVYRPIDDERFNGTVLVEWFNVSGGLEANPDWISAHTEMVRAGMIWVGVSAQHRGVEGGGTGGVLNIALKTANPARYGTLSHPGDSFSFDIYSQAGQALRLSPETNPLGDLPIERIIAIGESQSAARLTTYINAVHPLVEVYDGFLVHSRGGTGAPLTQSPLPSVLAPSPTLIRTDLTVPVLTFQTETDNTILGYFAARQADTKYFRLWEVAGTAHADTYTLLTGMRDKGDSPDVVAVEEVSAPIPGLIECDRPVNAGPQHWVLNAAVAALERWVRTGKPPRKAKRLEMTDEPAFVRDGHGNARGGIRTPWVDAPIATLSGEGQSGEGFCGIFGTTMLFDQATLTALYPSRRAFVKRYTRSMKRALKRGFLRRPDTKLMRAWLATTTIPD